MGGFFSKDNSEGSWDFCCQEENMEGKEDTCHLKIVGDKSTINSYTKKNLEKLCGDERTHREYGGPRACEMACGEAEKCNCCEQREKDTKSVELEINLNKYLFKH